MDLISWIFYLIDRLIILIKPSKIYHKKKRLVNTEMQKKYFLKTLLSCIVLFMAVQKVSATFCSAYCSYYNLGAAYAPMCAD